MLISLFCLETHSSEKAVLVLSFFEGSDKFSLRGKTAHERPVLIGIDWEEDLLIKTTYELNELCHKIYQNSKRGNCHQIA